MKAILYTIFNASLCDDLVFLGVALLWVFALTGASMLVMPLVLWIAQKLDTND